MTLAYGFIMTCEKCNGVWRAVHDDVTPVITVASPSNQCVVSATHLSCTYNSLTFVVECNTI